MIITQTPLRLSFFGGGTDFEDYYSIHGGAVISTTINKFIYVILKERFDDKIYVNYSQKEIVSNVDELQHELVREAMRITGVEKGLEITTLADIPSEGTGLGSSSAMTVGLLHALYAYTGRIVPAERLAEEACRIEIEILKKPIGRQDQYITAFGNLRLITFDKQAVTVDKVDISPATKKRLNDCLLLFYTGVTRKSIDILAEQNDNISIHIDCLSQMKNLVFQGRNALLQGGLDAFGELLNQGWMLKRSLASKIGNPVIDEIYETGLKAGAIGGKVVGAGGGGFILFYCPKSRQDNVCFALRGLRELPFRFQADGTKTVFNVRTGE